MSELAISSGASEKPVRAEPASRIETTTFACSRWLIGATGLLMLAVAVAYAYCTVFSRPLSLDEGYLMITVQSFIEGHPLYDSVFTQYGPFYYFYEWVVRALMAVPLTHDATRLLCGFHWLAASAVLGMAGGMMTRSVFAGAFVFMQAVVHLTAIASEPGHPQELVVLLLALGTLAAARENRGGGRLAALAVIVAALVFTKINVGLFLGFALLLAMRCHAEDRFARGVWAWLLLGVCAALPFLLMRRHLAAEWCRNYSLIAAGAVVASLLAAQRWSCPRNLGWGGHLRAAVFFLAPATVIVGMTALTGTSLPGLINGLLLTPLKMPGVTLLPLPLSNAVVWNAGASLALALLVTLSPRGTRRHALVTGLKLFFGIAGGLWLVGDAKFQFAYLLPWVWLVLAPGAAEEARNRVDAFSRAFLCLAAAWQGLQAYPIAGTQVTAGTFLLVLAYTVCLGDAWKALPAGHRIKAQLARLKPRSRQWAQALAAIALLGVFANAWCKLPERRRHYAGLPALDLPGSRCVRLEAETAGVFRELTQYLEAECDTFVTYPGIHSLYFWTGKRPPTHLNSTGWGQLSHAQQEHILAALRRAERPLLVVVAPAVEHWKKEVPSPIRPLVHCVLEESREVKRIGHFILFVPGKSEEPSPGG